MPIVKVIEGASAQYHRSSGLMRVGGPSERILEALQSASRDEDLNELTETFLHEWVHHIQALSCAQIRIEGLKTVQASINLIFSQDRDLQRDSAITLAWLNRRFDHRAFGVSMRDLCEGAAVLESYRIHYIEQTVDTFLAWRNLAFPGKGNSTYRRTFDILAHETNSEIAFDLLPVLTFLALQGDVPGASFDTLVRDERVRSGKLVGLPAVKIVEALGYQVLLEQFSRVDSLHPSMRHRTLYPIFKNLVDTVGAQEALEFAARPHRIRSLHTGMNESLMPPLVVGDHRSGEGALVAFGIARESQQFRLGILLSTALVSAAESIVQERGRRVPCLQQTCPNHATSLCNGYYAPPDDPSLCRFRSEVKAAAGSELFKVLETVDSLSLHDSLKPIAMCENTSKIFPEIRFASDAEHSSCAERFDQRFMLDAEDNDPVLLVFCRTPGCNSAQQIRSSKRSLKYGLLVDCSICGRETRVPASDISILNFERSKP